MSMKVLNRHKTSASKGFTLLEIMLVIAIIAAIAVLGLSGYKQMIMNRKIQKASVEMQMWVQASLQYYVDVNGAINSGSTKLSAENVINSGLMTNEDVGNPWVKSKTTLGGPGSYVLSAEQATPGTSYKIKVSTTIPTTNMKAKQAYEIARMIAGHLPFGVATGNNVSVTIVPPPALQGAASHTLIEHIYSVVANAPTTIPKPKCPADYKGHIYLQMAGFTTSSGKFDWQLIHSAYAHLKTGVSDWEPQVSVQAGGGGTVTPGFGNLTAIVTCEKDSPATSAGTQQNNNSNYVF